MAIEGFPLARVIRLSASALFRGRSAFALALRVLCREWPKTPVHQPFWAHSLSGTLLRYLRSRAVDTFTPCPISRIFETPSPGLLPDRVPMERILHANGLRRISTRFIARAQGQQ